MSGPLFACLVSPQHAFSGKISDMSATFPAKIIGWIRIRRDGMARMLMIGVVPTPLIVGCISWDLLVYLSVKMIYYLSCFLKYSTMKNHWRDI